MDTAEERPIAAWVEEVRRHQRWWTREREWRWKPHWSRLGAVSDEKLAEVIAASGATTPRGAVNVVGQKLVYNIDEPIDQAVIKALAKSMPAPPKSRKEPEPSEVPEQLDHAWIERVEDGWALCAARDWPPTKRTELDLVRTRKIATQRMNELKAAGLTGHGIQYDDPLNW